MSPLGQDKYVREAKIVHTGKLADLAVHRSGINIVFVSCGRAILADPYQAAFGLHSIKQAHEFQ
ncbi:MAG TPA: hypothetical protein PK765_02780 [bacterium]|nr:hypothetical protein [bacterium]